MVDRNNLNRVKRVLSAGNGAELPKYIVKPGDTLSQIILDYNKTNNTNFSLQDVASWNNIIDPNKIQAGQILSFTNSQQTTAIPGADPNQGNPNAAVDAAAQVNAAADAQSNAAIASATTQRRIESLSSLPVENKVTYNGPSAEEQFKNKANAYMNERVSAGMKFRQEEEKKEKILNGVGNFASEAVQAVGDVVGQKQMASDSELTKGITTGYDAVASGLQNAGGIAGVVGTAMQFAKGAGDIIQELGGGTDQQTTVDKIMDSPLFSWNIGMLNGFAGKNSDEFGLDTDTLSKVGSSYGGTSVDLQETSDKAGKKYGLFSNKKRKEANEAIAQARLKQSKMASIADETTEDRLLVQSMRQQKGLANSIMLDGGYSQKYTYSAKQGGSLNMESNVFLEWEPSVVLEWEPQIELNWELPVFKEGGNIDIVEELEWIPEFKSGNKIRTIEELIEYAKQKNPRFIQRLSEEPKGIKFIDDEGNEAEGSHYLESRGEYVVPRIQEIDGELRFLSPQEAIDRAMESGNYLEMTPEEAILFAEKYKQGWPEFFKKFKKGGSVGDSEIPEIEETSQKNVIPEGALHKNKHHMEHAEGLTKKGIPVIDEDGEQQAEIEHSEIIFTLEVTKKLEEYYKIFYSDESSNKEKEQAAIDAGKLLVYQILENTEDRTGLIESCKKGGSLTLKTTTDDLIEEVLSEGTTIVMVEEEDVKKKPKMKEGKVDKELMKEAIKEALIELLIK